MWMNYTSLFGITFVATMAVFTGFWILSIPLKNISIVDRLWAPGCALSGWIAFFIADGIESRKLLITSLVTIWSVRLCWHITQRNWGKGEDPRYTKLRSWRQPKENFHWISLRRVFLLQALLAWIVSLPLQVGQVYVLPEKLGLMSYIGAIIWSLGFSFEVIADRQLKLFKAREKNKGKLMMRGIWSWSRHPNYFGDLMVWIGLTLIACDNPVGLTTVISPLIMGYFLLNVTGKKLLEKDMRRRYSDYDVYVARTSSFFPLPPKLN